MLFHTGQFALFFTAVLLFARLAPGDTLLVAMADPMDLFGFDELAKILKRRLAMAVVADGSVYQVGTYNGNPLCMAVGKAVLSEVCTPEATSATIARNRLLLDACDTVIAQAGLPAHTVQFGAKGCVTWSEDPVRNYRDYKATDFDLAFAQWMHGINRGILLPPGLDEQWLVSVVHTDAEALRYAEVFSDFVDELMA